MKNSLVITVFSAIFYDTERKIGGVFLITACSFACVDACLSAEWPAIDRSNFYCQLNK